MKRIAIVVIIAVIGAFSPAKIQAQLMTQAQYDLLLVPVPITPLTTHFIDFGTGASSTEEGVDFATVGSLMPYRVNIPLTPDEIPANFTMDYMWLFTPKAPNATAKLDVWKMPTTVAEAETTVAATPATVTPNTDFFQNNEVSVEMPPLPGMVDLVHRVRYTFKGAEMCPETNPEKREQEIQVVARPSVKLNAEHGVGVADLEFVGCVEEPVTIPTGTDASGMLVVDGFADIIIQIKVTHQALVGDGGAVTTPFDNQWLKLTGNTLVFPGEIFTKPGVYTIDILNISDRISRKSLDQSLVKSVTSGANADTPPAGALKVYILPKITAPEDMEPVQHLRNRPL